MSVTAPSNRWAPRNRPQTRTWVVALVFVVLVAAGGAFSALVRYDLVGFGHLPRSAVFLSFLLLLLNAAWHKLTGHRVFASPQLVFIFIAVMVMSGFPGQQLVTYLYIGLVGVQHYATPENKWQETFFDFIPSWLVPSKDPDDPAVRWAFYGMPPGQSIPWHEWIVPLAVWTPYILAILLLGATTTALLRRRWADEEHMLFPLAQIPVEMLSYDSERARLPKVFRQWVFWAAFAIPVVLYSKNALHYYFPGIPETDLTPDIGAVFKGRPWDMLNYFPYYYYFEMMGIAYLVSDDLAFSLWFFWIFRRLGAVGRELVGLTNHADFFEHQGIGAYLALGLMYVWNARHSLRQIAEKAVFGRGNFDDSREPMSARFMVFGFLASLATIVLWGQAIGAAWWAALLLFVLYLISMVVLTRIVSEAGVFAVWSPFQNQERLIVKALGVGALGPRTITALGYMGYKIRDTASMTPGNVIQGYKMADMAWLNPRSVWAMMAASLVVALFASHGPSLYAIYTHSIPGLGWWPKNSGGLLGQSIAGHILANKPYEPGNYGNMALGAATVLVLNFLRQRFVWWIFHPLAFAALMGPSWMGDRYGFSIFLGWLARRITQRFGGYIAYRTGRAAAVGMIVGNAVVLLTWTIVHYFHPIAGVLITE
jgi:hypothetical protein